MRGNKENEAAQRAFIVVAVMFFGEKEVARYSTREQAEWKAKEMNEWAERNPRGYVQFVVRPARETRRKD